MRTVAPTKTNLLQIEQELGFARLGHELLDQKRNILVLELLNLVDQTVEFQERVERDLAEAYRTLQKAMLQMGRRRVLQLSSAVYVEAEMNITSRRVMGVRLPVVQTEFTEHPPYYGLMDTSFWIDEAIKCFKEVLVAMGHLAELKVSVMRLAREVRKTIRKVNALEKIAIPELEETVAFIRTRLEENEREMFVLMKMIKVRLGKKGSVS